jgi:mRNA interferase RelE/StbE
MELEYRSSFTRDLKRVRDADIRGRVHRIIGELEAASAIAEISGAVRIRAEGRYYRIRIGDYRLGIALEGDVAILVRFLHRRDVYRFFP